MTRVTKAHIDEILAQADITDVPSFAENMSEEEQLAWLRETLPLALLGLSLRYIPIDENTPRDGSRILVASSLDGRAYFEEIAKWDKDTKLWMSWYGTRIVQPKYWMPLPLIRNTNPEITP